MAVTIAAFFVVHLAVMIVAVRWLNPAIHLADEFPDPP
jgi:hypothetical protein